MVTFFIAINIFDTFDNDNACAGGSSWTGGHTSSDEDDAIIASFDINERAPRRIPV